MSQEIALDASRRRNQLSKTRLVLVLGVALLFFVVDWRNAAGFGSLSSTESKHSAVLNSSSTVAPSVDSPTSLDSVNASDRNDSVPVSPANEKAGIGALPGRTIPQGPEIEPLGDSSSTNDTEVVVDDDGAPSMTSNETNGIICFGEAAWGRDFHRIVQLCNLLSLLNPAKNQTVGLDEEWSQWYQSWFDDRPDVNLYHDVPNCTTTITPQVAFHLRNFSHGIPELQSFLPKASIRTEAQNAVSNWTSFVSVHRQVHDPQLAHLSASFCLGDEPIDEDELIFYSDITHADVKGTDPVVLFTDGQRSYQDETFPLEDTHPKQVQAWMMVLSKVHYGNPRSLMDYVVAHWRVKRDTRPHGCYSLSSNSTTGANSTFNLTESRLVEGEREQDSLDTSGAKNESVPFNQSSTTKDLVPNPICLGGKFWGKNFNRFMQLANALSLRTSPTQKLALQQNWPGWYRQWLDDRDDILLGYRGECSRSVRAQDIHFMRNWSDGMPELETLTPKMEYQQEAADAMSEPYVSVHRRNMDGECARREGTAHLFCFREAEWGAGELGRICDMVYNDVENTTLPVVLFSDEQRPELDGTFPRLDNHSFQVQSWMMVLSTIHYGNPMSSVDYVVSHWRKHKDTRPAKCFAKH